VFDQQGHQLGELDLRYLVVKGGLRQCLSSASGTYTELRSSQKPAHVVLAEMANEKAEELRVPYCDALLLVMSENPDLVQRRQREMGRG